MAGIRLEHLTKRFGERAAVDDVTIEIADREFVTLRNVRSQPAPMTRAVSSREGSIWRKAALAERTPSGT